MATPARVDLTFETLGPRISLFTPQNHTPGSLIILCTWLGATRKPILKYAQAYHTLTPHSQILLIESSLWIITSAYAYQRSAMQPAAEAVLATLAEWGNGANVTAKPNIIMHTFSNGGTNSATLLLGVLHRRRGVALCLTGILCDSGPARGTYAKSYHSMITSLPKGVVWSIIGPVIVSCVANTLFVSQYMGWWDKPEEIYRRTLLDAKVVDCNRICYAFSKADTHVDWEDVTSHADEARAKGWEVREVEFQGTPHCNHISQYREEYVGAMRAVWEGEALGEGKA